MKVQNKVKPGSNFFAHSLDNLFNEFFNEDLTKPLFRNRPSVNVLESNDDFKIEMTVPGLDAVTMEYIVNGSPSAACKSNLLLIFRNVS